MSFGSNYQRFSRPIPPERGSFPLDLQGLCKEPMEMYMSCLKQSENQTKDCRELSQMYLKCRMSKGLMDHDEMSNIGFGQKQSELLQGELHAKDTKLQGAQRLV